MYVPYGKPIADVKGNVQEAGIDASFCQNELSDKDNIGTLTICDAPGPGMARIFNAGTAPGYVYSLCQACQVIEANRPPPVTAIYSKHRPWAGTAVKQG